MKKEILNEINRFREILGLPLLKESIGKGLLNVFIESFNKNINEFSDFVKNGTDEIASSLRNSFDNLKLNFDDIIKDIKSNQISDDVVEKIVNALIESDNNIIKQKMASAFIDTNENLKRLSGEISNLSKESSDVFNISKDKISTEIDRLGERNEIKNELKRRLDNVKPKTDESLLTTSVTSQLKSMIDDSGELTEETKKVLKEIGKELGVSEDVIYNKAKVLIKQNKDMNLSELEALLSQSQVKLKESSNKLSGVKRKEFIEKWELLKKLSKDIFAPLAKPKQIFYIILGISVLIGAYLGFEYFQVDKEEAQNMAKRLKEECNKLTDDHFKITGSDEAIDKFYAKVVYNGQLVTFREDEGNFYLSLKNNMGDEIMIKCDDSKLGDKTVEEISAQPEKVDKNKVIDAIKKQGYTEPITLTPDKEPELGAKTEYTYTDKDSVAGTATVDENGNITVK